MSKSRVVLISSPVADDEHELERDRTAQLIDTVRAELDAQWIGWSTTRAKRLQTALSPVLPRKPAIRALDLSASEVSAIRDLANRQMLWPAFHSRPDLMQFDAGAYELFLAANRRLASALCLQLRADDLVWVHDYLHGPLACALREEGFEGAIGFLLHAPFPSPDQIATLPVHKEFVSELCCYDLLGFQTETCRANFHEAAQRFLGVNRSVSYGNLKGPFGKVETCVAEIPGRTQATARRAASAGVQRSERYLCKCSDGRELIGSFATLDPAQGLVERLKSFEALLELSPKMCSRISMIQAILTRRQWLEDDVDVGIAVEREFMRINGRFATLDWTPIRYFHKLLPPSRLTALYRSVRVGLFTPMSEGINLAAKDFVAAQNPLDPGVLVGSSLTGDSKFAGALYVNPYDVARVAMALDRALRIPLLERQARWSSMMDALEAQDMQAWCRNFVARLARSKPARPSVVAA